jgi:hypothetical protein
MTDFDFESAHYTFGVNEAGFEMERWWHDGTMAYCLAVVGLVSYFDITEAEFWALAETESARMEEA